MGFLDITVQETHFPCQKSQVQSPLAQQAFLANPLAGASRLVLMLVPVLTAKTGLDDFHYLFTYHVAEVSFKQHIKVFIYTNDSSYIQVMSERQSRYWMEATCGYPVI